MKAYFFKIPPRKPANVQVVVNYRSLSPETLERLNRKSPPPQRKPSMKFHQAKSPVSQPYRYTSNLQK